MHSESTWNTVWVTITEEEHSSLNRLEETIPELFQRAVVRQMGIDLFIYSLSLIEQHTTAQHATKKNKFHPVHPHSHF